MYVSPDGEAVPTAGFANANVGFPDGLVHQDKPPDRNFQLSVLTETHC